jgi:hypothetical protein
MLLRPRVPQIGLEMRCLVAQYRSNISCRQAQVLESEHAEDLPVAERFVESDIEASEEHDVRVQGSGAGLPAHMERHLGC